MTRAKILAHNIELARVCVAEALKEARHFGIGTHGRLAEELANLQAAEAAQERYLDELMADSAEAVARMAQPAARLIDHGRMDLWSNDSRRDNGDDPYAR